MGLRYPTHFLKCKGSVIRNISFEYRTKQVSIFARPNGIYIFSATNKEKIYSIGIFRVPVVTQFIVKA